LSDILFRPVGNGKRQLGLAQASLKWDPHGAVE